MKKLGNFLVAFLLLGGIFANAEAKLDDDFRENFTDIIKELCYSAIEYSPDDKVGLIFDTDQNEAVCTSDKCAEYHKTMQCMFHEAFSLALSDINQKTNAAGDESLTQIFANNKISYDPSSCNGQGLGDVQNTHRSRGFETTCTETPHLSQVYSPCRVAETVLLEFCGYQKFLAAKSTDRISYQAENPNFEGSDIPATVQSAYFSELKKAESTMTQMLELYRNFEQHYRFNAWLMAFHQEILPLQPKLIKFWENMALFPDKFVSPSRDS